MKSAQKPKEVLHPLRTVRDAPSAWHSEQKDASLRKT
jgi:hypothetical protein